MGHVNHPVKLKKLIEDFEIKNYVESGTGDGTSFNRVYDASPELEMRGVELDIELCDRLASTHKSNDNVTLYQGYTEGEFPQVLDDMSDEPALFFLDAHFPDADYGGAGYGDESDTAKRIPMETELRIMADKRDLSKDVIVMDDLRIYVDRGFAAGNWDQRRLYGGDGYDFVEDIIGETHILVEHHDDQGYLLCFPINKSEDEIREVIA